MPAPRLTLALLLLLLAGCGGSSSDSGPTEPDPDVAWFIQMAKSAICADISNKLWLVDNTLVLWRRTGNCPDAAYETAIFQKSTHARVCWNEDSIGGPVTGCSDPSYLPLWDEILGGGGPNCGLGPDHTCEPIPF